MDGYLFVWHSELKLGVAVIPGIHAHTIDFNRSEDFLLVSQLILCDSDSAMSRSPREEMWESRLTLSSRKL